MKCGKRILSICLVALMVLQLVPAVGAQEQTVTVYVDQVNGDDTNNGLSESAAMKTLDGAYRILYQTISDPAATDGKIVLVNDYEYEFTSSVRKDIASSTYVHTYDLTICGKTPDVSLTFKLASQSYLGVIGPTTFENLNMRLSDDSANPYLSIHGRGSGHYLKIGQGVTGGSTEANKISLSAAPYFQTTQTKPCTLEINSGDWRNVYASGYTANITGNGHASLVINGGTVLKAGVVYNGTHNGDATITVNGGTVGTLYTAAVNTGSVSGDVVVTINGGELAGELITKNMTGNATVVLAPTRGVVLSGGKAVAVNTLTGGALSLTNRTSLQITDSVTGKTEVSLPEGVYYGAYITAPAATPTDAIVFAQEGITVTDGTDSRIWECTDPEKIVGLILKAKSGVTVKLYTGFSNGTQVTPSAKKTADGYTSYYFPNVSGSYRYIASGTGYYKVTKNIYVSNIESLETTVMDVTPLKRAGTGWDPTAVSEYTDEMLAQKPSDPTLWPDYQEAFATPRFTDGAENHQQTTQQTLETYIAEVAEDCSYMYVFSYGISPNGHNLPLVIFTKTDLSGAQTLEQAAALLKSNGKLTVHYQAQMHGNEPAGCEAALAMIYKLSGSYGAQVLDQMNIYVLPRINPDGAELNQRSLPTLDMDMNRDHLLLQNKETQLLVALTNLMEPAMVIDSHEYTCDTDRTSDAFSDLLISPGYNPTSNREFVDLGITMTKSCFEKVREQGLTYNYYTSIINSRSAYVGRNYISLKGTLFFLIESRGIGGGMNMYERRVVGHLITATELLDYVCANTETVRTVVENQRQTIVNTGKTYEESDFLVLQSSAVSQPEHKFSYTYYDTATGTAKTGTITPKAYISVDRSRVAPTAYVIPAGESWTRQVLALMDSHNIRYSFIPAGAVMELQQYTGSTAQASLTEPMGVYFEQGAYVFTMDQVPAKILSILMEPDVDDVSGGSSTLAMAGIIPQDNGTFPIYRYIRNLNDDGTVDYSVAPAAPSELSATYISAGQQTGSIVGFDPEKLYEYRAQGQTQYTQLPKGTQVLEELTAGVYYVRYCATDTQTFSAEVRLSVDYEPGEEYVVYLSAAGSDSNDGATQQTPVATVEKAYSLLDDLIAQGRPQSVGRVVVMGTVSLTAAPCNFPSHEYSVTLAGLTASDGFTFKGASTAKNSVLGFNGPTTLENLKLTLTGTTIYNYLCANGHKLVIGKGVDCVANSKDAYFNVVGGSYSGTYSSTDVTIMSGSWRNIYYGTYTGTVNGDVTLTMTGGSYTNYIQANYKGTVQGNATVNLSNTALGTRVVGGNINAGDVNGNVTVTLGAGITGTTVIDSTTGIASSTVIGPTAGTANVKGSYTVILDGADTTDMTISGISLKTGTVKSSSLVLQSGIVGTVADFDTVTLVGSVQLGTDITSNMTVEGDSRLDLNGHTLSGTVTGSGTLHGMDSATDDYTSENAGRITGTVSCAVAARFKNTDGKRYLAIADDTGYSFHRFFLGITHASVKPNAKGVGYKAIFAGSDLVKSHVDSFGYSLTMEGNDPLTVEKQGSELVSLQPVSLRVKNYDAEHWGEAGLTAQVFMVIDGETVYGSEVTYSLRQMVESVNNKFRDYTADQLAALANWIGQNETMKSWEVENICDS